MCDNQNKIGNSATEEAHPLIELSEMKREPDIKVEPSSASNLAEFPIFKNSSNQQSLDVPIGCGWGDVSSSLTIDGIKIEVKVEIGIQNARVPILNKTNGNGNEYLINNRQNNLSSRRNVPQMHSHSNRNIRIARNATKSNVRENVRKVHHANSVNI